MILKVLSSTIYPHQDIVFFCPQSFVREIRNVGNVSSIPPSILILERDSQDRCKALKTILPYV